MILKCIRICQAFGRLQSDQTLTPINYLLSLNNDNDVVVLVVVVVVLCFFVVVFFFRARFLNKDS